MSAANASNPRVTYAHLQYCLREKLWRHAQTIAHDMHSALSDFTFLLWKAFASDREGNVAEALREYKQCEGKRGVTTAALIGMQLIFKRNKDTESLAEIQTKLDKDAQRPNFSAITQAATMLWHAGEVTRARELIAQVLDSEPEYRDEYTSALTVRGWLDLSSGRGGTFADKCLQLFDRVLQAEAVENMVDIDAVLGKVAVLEKKNQFWPAQELLNKCLVAHRGFLPAMVVKTRQLLRVDDWDQAADTVTTILANDPMSVEALILSTLNLLVREARVQAATRTIADLIKALQVREPRNGQLYLTCAQCFSRLASSSLPVLTLTTSLAESAAQLMPQSSDAAAEVAFQSSLRGDVRTATSLYKKASTLGDGNAVPLVGLISCAIQQGSYAEAAKQLDFLNEISSGGQQKNPELLFLGSQLQRLQIKNGKAAVELLDRAVEAQRQEYSAVPSGTELYIKLNPHLMMLMAREYVHHCRTEPGDSSRPDPLVEKTRRLLDQLLRLVPGSTDAQLLNARMAYISGDHDRASSLVAASIRQDQGLADAHMLQATILQHTGNYAGATQALELALSLDFDINDTPTFNALRGTLLYHKGEYEGALAALKTAVAAASPAAATPADPVKSSDQSKAAGNTTKKGQLSAGEHVGVYLQLAQTYVKMRDAANAKQTIREALQKFGDTPHVGRVQIAQALLLAHADAEQAFTILRAVPASSPHFLAAKAHMAQLYLSLRGNRRAFARCYEEVVEALPSVLSYMHLGDAYAGIQEPDKAIVAYEKARAMDPNNAELSVKIGRTLVTTHDYQRALRYYRDAVVAEPNLSNLRSDLSGLYWRLGDHDKAVQTLREAPVMRRPPAQDELPAALERVQVTMLQASIFKDAGKMQNAVDCLIQARVYQASVVQKARSEPPEVVAHEKSVAAGICLEIGDYHAGRHDHDRALHYYTEALKHDEVNATAMLNLARLYLQRGESDNCEMQCNALLRVQPACEEAIVMLADLMFRRGRYDDAAYHFLQLLDRQPDNYGAMVHYVHLLRRSGHLSEAPRVFENAEKTMKPGQRPDPGFCYARGMYYKFVGNSREALTYLNLARLPRGNPWSQKALSSMIELYINPSQAFLWEDSEVRTEVEDNIRTAEKLLTEIESTEKRQLLQGYIYAASKRKDLVEQALSIFQDLNESRIAAAEAAQTQGGAHSGDGGADTGSNAGGGDDGKDAVDRAMDRLYAPAVVGMAIAHQILKQSSKARTFLKRLTKPNYNADEEDDFERGYLLLGSIYIENGKHDLAQGLLNKAIAANKSCGRAWELLGLIYEREQSYRDASDCYERAWSLQGEKDPAIGFKLAFNYLKAKRHVQAIDVCHKVLGAHPTYPKIRKEILERARLSLRP